MGSMTGISVVIPVLNEEGSLPELLRQLKVVLGELNQPWEIIAIDDGSTDASGTLLEEAATEDEHIQYVQFHRNYGKSAALNEGFRRARYDKVVTMDADLQDDPAEIPNLVNKLEEGYDLVSGWKRHRQDPWTKTFPSKIWNRTVRWITGVKIHDFNCGLKIYRSSVTHALEIYGGRHRYIPALAGQRKFRVGEIPVKHHPRLHGKTKYGGARFFHGIFDLLTILFLNRFDQQPLHLFGSMGLGALVVGTVMELYLLYAKYLLGHSFKQHLALLILGVMIILIGIQFFSIGLLGELIARTQQHSENRVKRSLP
ncbi:MAG: glycosyltransferase [Candidatus Neomarinimicrobiota bacterium]|nr:MAG: glycosyltransferase [Candidatus Neomarinimicrobiota bacterium]